MAVPAQGMADQRQQAAASCQGQWLGGGAGPSTGMGGVPASTTWMDGQQINRVGGATVPSQGMASQGQWMGGGAGPTTALGWLGRHILQPQEVQYRGMLASHHVIQSPCNSQSPRHQFTISSTMLSIHHVVHSPCHPFTMSSIHPVIHSPCHPFTMSSIHHVILSP